MQSLLKQIIELEFRKRVVSIGSPCQAMVIRVKVPTPQGFEGYAQKTLVLYAPTNYVQVLTRQEWEMISEEALDDESGDLLPGWDYETSATEWTKLADHDSGWREGVAEFVGGLENAFSFRESPGDRFREDPGVSWYAMVHVPEEARCRFKKFLEGIKPMAREI
jgi:hypothetical protein